MPALEQPRAPIPMAGRVSSFDALLRIGLAGMTVYLLYLGIRLLAVAGATPTDFRFRPVSPPAAAASGARAPRSGAQFDTRQFPFPLHPGARNVEGFQMQFNGGDFARCEFYTVADAATVLRYYRGWLMERGWRDWVQDSFRRDRPALGQLEGLPADLQNESMLRFYDRMQREQLNCARGDERFTVFVKSAENQPFGTQVALQYTERGVVGAMGQSTPPGTGVPGAGAPLFTFTQELGRDRLESRVVQSRKRESDLYASMVSAYLRDGWRQVTLPPALKEKLPENYAQFTRGGETLIVNVQGNPHERGSAAIVTRMSSAPSP